MISIALATYNGGRYIREQIESIQRQTIQDFELIICDDCSKDNTCAIIEEMCMTDARIKLYKNNSSLGFKKNFEKAISLCNGEFIALSDQDDVWYECHLSELLSALKESKKALAAGDANMVDSNLSPIGLTNFRWMSFDNLDADEMEMADSIALWRGMLSGMNMMFTKELKRLMLPFPEKCNYHDVWISLLACFCGGVCIVDKPISSYRRHESNVTIGLKNSRHPRLRSLLGHALRVYNQEDRMSALDRIEKISVDEHLDLDPHFYTLKKVVERRSDFRGRLMNVFYEIENAKRIYTMKS